MMSERQLNILILYVTNQYPPRATLWDQLYSFRQYSNHRCFYLNLNVRKVPWYIKSVKFDLIVFGTLFLSTRVVDEWFAQPLERVQPLKSLNAVKVACPQDEYVCTDVLSDFINEFQIDCIFSVAPPSEWSKIYGRVDTRQIKIFKILTGYLDESTLARIDRLRQEVTARTIDLGYRTWRAAPNLGRHGFLRQQIAEIFQTKAPDGGLVTDISTRREDTLWGDAWYRFLLRCKYTMSVEGGASVLDRDGSIQRLTEEYLAQHPDATSGEVEAACFPGLDGQLRYVALSPRHLEACATRTCQVLVEGEYDGVLLPAVHYIELKRDFSNVEEVVASIKRDDLRAQITERAYRDIVASGHYTYRTYVDSILHNSMSQAEPAKSGVLTILIYQWMRASDYVAWAQLALNLYFLGARARQVTRRLLAAILSEETVTSLLNRFRKAK